MGKRWLVIALLGGLVFAGWQSKVEETNNSNSVQASSKINQGKVKTVDNGLYKRAIAKFKATHPQAIITSFSWEVAGSKVKAEVEGQDKKSEYQAVFDQNGKLIHDTSEANDDYNWRNDEIKPKKLISLATAVKKAQSKVSGSLVSASLEKDDGRDKWEIKIKDHQQEVEVILDARSGKIISKEIDD